MVLLSVNPHYSKSEIPGLMPLSSIPSQVCAQDKAGVLQGMHSEGDGPMLGVISKVESTCGAIK